MIRPDPDHFSDPSLKSALQRAHGSESAPLSLRTAVQQTLAGQWAITESPAPRSIGNWQRWQSLIYSALAASVVLLGVSILVMAYLGYFDQRRHVASSATPTISTQLVNAMVARHQSCGALKDHHLVTGNNIEQIKSRLQAQLGFPVTFAMPADGWTFKGAGRCSVGDISGAHFLFERGKQEVSVFALPADSVRQVHTGSTVYQNKCGGCPVAAAVHGPALYAAVGSSEDGSLLLPEVAAIRDQFLAAIPDQAVESCLVTPPIAASLPVAH